MKRIALASLVALAAGLPTLSHAFDGRIQFSGKIFDTTCKINPSDTDKLVEFPQLKPADFDTNGRPANTLLSPTEFSIQLSNCTFSAGSTPKAKIKFDDLGALVDRNNGGLMNLTGTDYAENVQVNLYGDSAGTQKLMLGSNPATPSFAIDSATNSVTLKYYANLVRQDTTGPAGVRPGIYNSQIRYQIAYE
ncbi:hypothetical protein BKK79_19220 [Cupriavidus sp. USMAA2-4]|uniref:Fimbrial-type adhesion domain-containing protein n=1 Tax=Cupriavidus malaysiensis TaxID=367825 RepID=A0ABN4TNR0_9BURK|nr:MULTISPECIES: fimbrial protein [Cupriavidus]AOY93698.1 hypothetical protein BKK79_19220 [Cupriavidus sp. USMAA2-4]AOZ00025.1 hypothetical protein BKK81_12860 [Cupriavidus sp. USMAHM13]AOZ06638.1 hypothetical protein BKK80_13075 [Cupriavidus malaysiensis]